jgi:hypothetical protein
MSCVRLLAEPCGYLGLCVECDVTLVGTVDAVPKYESLVACDIFEP